MELSLLDWEIVSQLFTGKMLNPGFVAEFGGRILLQRSHEVQKIVKTNQKLT
jgi:hypothetical protein